MAPGLSPAQQEIERDPAAYRSLAGRTYDARSQRDSAIVATPAASRRRIRSASRKCRTFSTVQHRSGTEATNSGGELVSTLATVRHHRLGKSVVSQPVGRGRGASIFEVGAGRRRHPGTRRASRRVAVIRPSNCSRRQTRTSIFRDATNKSILDMQMISNQANQDYSQAALSHFADNETKFSGKRINTTASRSSTAWFECPAQPASLCRGDGG